MERGAGEQIGGWGARGKLMYSALAEFLYFSAFPVSEVFSASPVYLGV
jgi:hypothetical protein